MQINCVKITWGRRCRSADVKLLKHFTYILTSLQRRPDITLRLDDVTWRQDDVSVISENQSIKQLTNKSIIHTTNQSTNPPYNQSTSHRKLQQLMCVIFSTIITHNNDSLTRNAESLHHNSAVHYYWWYTIEMCIQTATLLSRTLHMMPPNITRTRNTAHHILSLLSAALLHRYNTTDGCTTLKNMRY